MVQNNKVLTVSYGTFSCTLEGFEDSFGTMKAIAEYFRDLASDDRYFGAEPPQPDADMLARIAQREVARQVEARTSAEGIHLRAATNATPESATPAVTAAPSEPATALADQPAAQDEAQTEATEPEVIEETVAEPEILDTPVPEAPKPDPAKLAAISAAVAAEHGSADTKDAADVIEEPAAAEDATESASQDETATTSSIAAKLRRIRAVVASTPEDEFSEDEHAESLPAEPDMNFAAALDQEVATSVAEAVKDSPAELEVDERVDAVETSDAADVAEPDALETDPEIARVMGQLQSQDEALQNANDPASVAPPAPVATAEEPPVDAPEDTAVVDSELQPPKRIRARVTKVKRRDIEQALDAGSLQQIIADIQSDDTPAASPSTEPKDDEILEETTVKDGLSDSDEVGFGSALRGTPSSLSDDDEADLLRELAAVEADLLAASQDSPADAAEDLTADDDIMSESEAETEAEEPVALSQETETAPEQRQPTILPDSDIARLMDTADEKLEAQENADSRESYGHLRAAAAVTQAERSAGDASAEPDEEQPYREDLAEAVRPRRPTSREASAPRTRAERTRPAPLKLVAEQMVPPEVGEAKSVRPRRISVLADDSVRTQDDAGSFAEYAKERGAVELNELLEAAAAYMSFVEGRNHFSRPQLINAVRETGTQDFNREDGLRSFGVLLREGKIERSENGRFAATREIGFQPPKRAAG